MKMAFGLVGLLVAVGAIVWIMSSATLPATQQALEVRKEVKPKVEQMAGKTAQGGSVAGTIKVDAETSGGRMTSLIVTDITAGAEMQRYFGLQRGDSIVEIAVQGGVMMPVKEMGDAKEAKDYLQTAYQNSQQLVVVRDGQRLTLPAAAAAGGTGGPGGAKPADSGSSIQKQLQGIGVPK